MEPEVKSASVETTLQSACGRGVSLEKAGTVSPNAFFFHKGSSQLKFIELIQCALDLRFNILRQKKMDDPIGKQSYL